MRPIVSFLSDFGLLDPYAGTVKAVMLVVCPDLAIVDLTHEVAPQAVAQGAFLAQQSWPYFPTGAVHLAVVDPGVGTTREPLALRTPAGYFVGPDNGLLSAALPEEARGRVNVNREIAVRLPLPPGYELRRIANLAIVRRDASTTFHGRDVFGPAAAHLAAGMPFEQVGPVLPGMLVLPPFRGVCEGAVTHGFVIHVDRFGNLITTVHRDDLPPGAAHAEIGGRRAPLVRTYDEGEGLVALVGSSGYLEVALVNGSAASGLGLGAGSPVTVRGR